TGVQTCALPISIERHAASENPLRATTINDFAKLGTALGGTPTIVERLPNCSWRTFTPASRRRGTGATPLRSFKLQIGLWATVAPASAIIAMSSRESQTPWITVSR